MYKKGIWVWLFIFILSFSLFGCFGGGGSSSSEETTSTTRTTGTATISGLVDSTTTTTRRSIDRGPEPTSEGRVELIVDLNGDGVFSENADKVYEGVIKEDGSFSFANVEVNKEGTTKAKLVVKKEGRAPFEKILTLSDGTSLTLNIQTKPVEKVTVDISRDLRRDGGYLIFAITKNSDGTTRAIVKRATRADDIDLNATEAGITVPVANIPENVTQLTASLRLFSGNETAEFPGEFRGVGYTRAEGDEVQLKSIAFLYADFVDQNGTKVEFLEGNETKAEVCTNLLTWLSVPSDQISNLEDDQVGTPGYQVPVWRYNPTTGFWEYITEGTLYYGNGTEVPDNATLDPSSNYYVKVCLPPGWTYCNLDYGVWIGQQPKEVNVCVKTVDKNDSPLSGVWVYAQGTSNVGNTYVYGTTNSDGVAILKLSIPQNDNLTDIERIENYYDFYWNYWKYGYTYSIKADDENLSAANNSECDYELKVTVTNPFDAQIKVRLKDEDNNTLSNRWVEVYSSDYTYWNFKLTDQNGEATFDVKSGEVYYIYALGKTEEASVDETLNYNETSDNGYTAIVDFKKTNVPPQVYVYLSPYQAKPGTLVNLYVYGYDPNGDSLSLTQVTLNNNKDITSQCTQDYSYPGYASWTCKVDTTGLSEGSLATVSAVVSDGALEGSGGDTLFIVANRPPVVYGVDILDPSGNYVWNWDSLKTNTEYTFKIYAYDPDGDNMTYSIDVNGTTLVDNTTNTTFSYSFPQEGDYEIKITPKDSEGSSGNTYTITVHVGNAAPQILTFASTTSNATPGDSIEVVAYISDDGKLNEDNLSVSIDNENATFQDLTCEESYNSFENKYYYKCKGDVRLPEDTPQDGYFTITLTVTDNGEKTATDSFKFWVNKPPVIEGLLPSNITLTAGDSYTFKVSAYDPDGDPLTYTWYIGENEISECKNSNTCTYTFDSSGDFEVKCEVSDGQATVSTTSQVKVALSGTLGEVEEAFNKFLENSTDENYQAFINAANALTEDTPEANLFRGIATFAQTYEDHKSVFQKYFGIDNLEDLEGMNSTQLIHNVLYAENADYNGDLKPVFSDLESKLQQVYSYFDQAESGVGDGKIGITINNNVVYFDKYDFKCLKALTKFIESMCYLGEAINMGDGNINWTVNGTDLRTLIENGEEITSDLWNEFFNNNPDLLSWSSTDKFDDFKQAVEDLKTLADELSNAFNTMDENTLLAREDHAFEIDDPAGVARLESIANFLDSFVKAFSDKTASLIFIGDDWKSYQAVQYGGKWFKAGVYDFTKFTIYPSADQQITIYDLVNGNKSLRDLLSYDGPFYDNKTEELWKQDVYALEEELETYEVPIANISIDGSADDWASVPVFMDVDNLGIKIKLARSVDNKFYVYLEYEQGVIYSLSFNLSGWTYNKTSYKGVVCWVYKDDFFSGSETFYENNESTDQSATLQEIKDNSGNVIGVEAEFPDFASLTKSSLINTIYIRGCTNSTDCYSWSDNWVQFWKDLKLLPVSEE